MDPVTLATIAIAITAASTAASAYGAMENNKSVKKSMRSAAAAAEIRARQNASAASLQRQKNVNEYQRNVARVQVRAAETGTGISDSLDALQGQATADLMLNQKILTQNEAANFASIQSGAQVDFANLASRIANPLLAAFQGGLQGASTGLQIAGGVRSLGAGTGGTAGETA